MSALGLLIADVDTAIDRHPGGDRARALSRILDLMVAGGALPEDHLALFDAVIERFAAAIETRARVDLAARLADLRHPPPRSILRLAADDEIAVARPLLAGRSSIDDQDLVSIALAKGQRHMRAISERRLLSETVTDILVAHGDGGVRHAVVANGGARLSPLATAALLDHCRTDEALQDLLGERDDLLPDHVRRLVEIAGDTARRRLADALAPDNGGAIAAAVANGAVAVAGALERGGRPAGDAAIVVRTLAGRHRLDERALAGFVAAGRTEHTLHALAHLSGLPLAAVARIFEDRDNDLLIVLGRAQHWSWRTIADLLRLRDPSLTEHRRLRAAQATFDNLSVTTARRVLGFLHAGGSAGRPQPGR